MKPLRNILCYSYPEFNKIMEQNGWIRRPPNGVSCVSICSLNESDMKHWFNENHTDGLITNNRVFNLDIDDLNPFWFKNHESKCYDDSLELYKNGRTKESNAYFSHVYIYGANKEHVGILHAFDYEEAFKLAKWIDWRIKHDKTIYIHCAVGASRSQGVVRYIVDTYGAEYDIKLNPNNPNDTYNPHITMMLKRAYRELYYNDVPNSYFQTEPVKKLQNIKLNIL